MRPPEMIHEMIANRYFEDSMLLSCVVSFAAVVVSIFLLYMLRSRVTYVPGVAIIPSTSIFGFTQPFMSGNGDSHRIMLDLAEKSGNIFQFTFLGQHIVAVSDKSMVKNVLRSVRGKGYPLHGGNRWLNHPSTFSLDTNADLQIRRNAFRSAFSMNSLKKHGDYIRLLCIKLCDILDTAAQKQEVVEMDKLFGQLTVDVICEVAFQLNINSIEDSSAFQDIHNHLRTLFESNFITLLPIGWLANVLICLPIASFRRYRIARKRITEFCRRIWLHIQSLESDGQLISGGLPEAFLHLSRQKGITEEDILAEIRLIFIAGHETTAHTLSWFLYAMAKNPEVQRRCQRVLSSDIQSVVPSIAVSYTSTLPPYLEACLKESMRRYPVAAGGSVRQVQNPTGFDLIHPNNAVATDVLTGRGSVNHHVNSGSWILVNFFALHNSTMNWGPNALEFCPERWLDEVDVKTDIQTISEGSSLAESKLADQQSASDELQPSISNGNPLASPAVYSGGGKTQDELSFAPFSYGIRNCLGMNLAMMEIRITIAQLVNRFNFTLADESLLDETVALETHFTMRPHNKLPIRVDRL